MDLRDQLKELAEEYQIKEESPLYYHGFFDHTDEDDMHVKLGDEDQKHLFAALNIRRP